jgi:HK97 family phage portal protein
MASWYNEERVRQPGSVVLRSWMAQRAAMKESAVGRTLAGFSLGRPAPTPHNYANFAREAYQLNIIAYRCIELIATSAAMIPLLVYRDDKEIEDAEHPLLQLLRRPNPAQSGKELLTALYSFDALAGNAYMERVMLGRKEIKELYAHRPDRMRVVPGRFGLPQRYEYKAGSSEPVKFDVDPVTGEGNILHLRRFNPLDDWYGQSPLAAAGLSVDSHNEATRWNFALLRNGARPSGAMEYPSNLDDTEFNRLKDEITANYSSAGDPRPGVVGRQGRPMLLQGGLKWVQMMLDQMDLDWARGKEISAREIALAFKVPEQLVGVPGQQTYNNYREARLALYEDAVLPVADRFCETFTNWLQSIPAFDGLRVAYDEDRIPAMTVRREMLWDKVNAAKFLSIDEKRAALGYDTYTPDAKEPGSYVYVTASELPLTEAFNDFAADSDGEALDTDPQLDEEGNPLPAVGGDPAATEGALGGAPAGGPVQDLALNGAQIQAAVQIVQAVADGTLPAESAIQLLLVAFPSIDEATARAMIAPAEEFEPEKPQPPPMMMPGVPPQLAQGGKPPKPAETEAEKSVMRAVLTLTLKRRKARRAAALRKAHELAYGRGA